MSKASNPKALKVTGSPTFENAAHAREHALANQKELLSRNIQIAETMILKAAKQGLLNARITVPAFSAKDVERHFAAKGYTVVLVGQFDEQQSLAINFYEVK